MGEAERQWKPTGERSCQKVQESEKETVSQHVRERQGEATGTGEDFISHDRPRQT